MRWDSTVEDLVAKILLLSQVPSEIIQIYRVGWAFGKGFSIKSARAKNQAQKIFDSNTFVQSFLVRFSSQTEVESLESAGSQPVFVKLSDEEK